MEAGQSQERRYLVTLQQLFAIRAADLRTALSHAADAMARATGSDKVDAFLFDESRDSLVALGTSAQPLTDKQKMLGLDVLPLANGGSVVRVFTSGQLYRTGNLQADPDELRGVKEGLGVQSHLGVPLEVRGERRGVLMLASLARDFFTPIDEVFIAMAAQWVGNVAERAELVETAQATAAAQARAASTEETIEVLAHDLRNYLSPVVMRLVRIRASVEDNGQVAQDADVALRTLDDLAALVSDLLDSARLEHGAFDLAKQPVDIVRLAHDAAAALTTVDHAILVRASRPMMVAADPRRMRQCLDNVLSNALRHSPSHAPVTVTIASARDKGVEWARVEVVDEGPGVADAVMPHLFQRFASGRRNAGGTGLGLYIAKRIATAHGGDIEADRYPEKGARFTITLPLLPGTDER
jgi:two-component system, OmpR family, sensor kinase